MKFLIDECLSPTLADLAIREGYSESSHVTHRGMTSWEDHRLMKVIIDDDWTFVTRNSGDFRPRPGDTSQAPCYVGQLLHAGLVCLKLPVRAKEPEHRAYFLAALARIEVLDDLVNKVLEVDPSSNIDVIVDVYDFPGSLDLRNGQRIGDPCGESVLNSVRVVASCEGLGLLVILCCALLSAVQFLRVDRMHFLSRYRVS